MAAGEMVVGSVEYGVLHTGARLVAVIGHDSCGAVQAAIKGHKEPGTSIEALVKHVKPAAAAARDKLYDLKGKDLLAEAVERNVLHSMRELLLASPKISQAVKSGSIKVVGGIYSLHTGRISWMGEHPSQMEFIEKALAVDPKKK
jgi:carbonic anhydrase